MSIDMFQPRVMRAALEQLKEPRQFLRPLFFSTVETQETEHVDVDVITEGRRLAPFVSPNGPGKLVEREGYTTSTVTPPMVAPKMVVTIPDLQNRVPGEHVYAQKSAEERLGEIVRRDLRTLENSIARTEEWMCAQALFNSAIAISGDDVTRTITFSRDSSVTKGLLGASDRWSAATADIPKQIRGWRRDIIKLCGLAPDVMIASPEAIDAMLANDLLLGTSTKGGQLNTLSLNMGQLYPQIRESGAVFIGMFAGTNIEIWSYDEWYIDPATGTEKPMVPEKTILLGSTRARTAMRYGAVGVKAGDGIALIADSRVPESWVTQEPAVRHLKVSSRPLPVPIQNNAFLTAQVVA